MISRTKANYSIFSLAKSLFLRENNEKYRQEIARKLEHLLGSSYILLTASGRGALYLLLLSIPRAKVFIPAYTCKAVVEAALLAGKSVYFGESELDGFNMDTNISEEQIDKDTILIVTHQFGIPCQLEPLINLAHQKGAFVIEDAAASLGSKIGGQLTGTFGDASFFSFDSTKLLNVPLKGGFLWIRDPDIFAQCQEVYIQNTSPMPLLRKFYYLTLGFALRFVEQPTLYRVFHNIKFHWRGRFTEDSAAFSPHLNPFYYDRFSEWQAAILIPQLDRFDQIIANRRRLYNTYLLQLAQASFFSLPPHDIMQEWAPIRFPIRVLSNKMQFYEEAVRRGVDFAFSFTFLASPSSFAISHKLADTILDLPFYDRLSEHEQLRVISVLLSIDKIMREIWHDESIVKND